MKKVQGLFTVSRKCQYALRALYELAMRGGNEPVAVKTIANSQGIPQRFLETILNELKQNGFVVSVRGKGGGYLLTKRPEQIEIGRIISFIEQNQVVSDGSPAGGTLPVPGDFAFEKLWSGTEKVLLEALYRKTLKNLLDDEARCRSAFVGNYII